MSKANIDLYEEYDKLIADMVETLRSNKERDVRIFNMLLTGAPADAIYTLCSLIVMTCHLTSMSKKDMIILITQLLETLDDVIVLEKVETQKGC